MQTGYENSEHVHKTDQKKYLTIIFTLFNC
jgi:hypothetical protein